MGKEKNVIPILIDIITVVFCCFSFLELTYPFYEYIKLFLFIFWILLISLVGLKPIVKNKFLILLVFYVFCCLIYSMATRGIIFGFKYSLLIILSETPLFMLMYYLKDFKNKEKFVIRLVNIIIGVLCFLCFNMLYIIAGDPNAARIMAGTNNIYENRLCGGGYGLAYTLCVLTPYIITNIRKSKYKIISILVAILFTYTLIKCSYTIAIIIFIVELFVLGCLNIKSVERNRGVAFVIFCLCLLLCYCFKKPIGHFLVNDFSRLFSGSFVEIRIAQLGEYLEGKIDDLTRLERYRYSIKSFTKYPLIGVSYFTHFSKEIEVFYKGVWYVGNHSAILDGLARVGIIYFLYLAYFAFAVKYIHKNTKSLKCTYICIMLIVIKFINVATFGVNCAVLLIIPLLESINRNKLKEGKVYVQNEKKYLNN